MAKTFTLDEEAEKKEAAFRELHNHKGENFGAVGEYITPLGVQLGTGAVAPGHRPPRQPRIRGTAQAWAVLGHRALLDQWRTNPRRANHHLLWDGMARSGCDPSSPSATCSLASISRFTRSPAAWWTNHRGRRGAHQAQFRAAVKVLLTRLDLDFSAW